jgi:muconolactone delta-isomerase
MKDVFLVHIRLPELFTTEFYNLIPKQRALINALLAKQVILSYSLDMERKNVWCFFQVKDETELMDTLSRFPIIKDVKVSIHELAFYDSAPVVFPDLIMN